MGSEMCIRDSFTAVVGLILKNTVGIRVSPEDEEAGLDVSEHGMKAYN